MTTWCLVYWPMQGHVQNSLLNKRRWFSFFLLFLATRSMRRLQWRGLFKLLVPSPVFSSSSKFVWRFHRPQKVQPCWTDAFLRQLCFSIASVILLCFSSLSELKLSRVQLYRTESVCFWSKVSFRLFCYKGYASVSYTNKQETEKSLNTSSTQDDSGMMRIEMLCLFQCWGKILSI